MDIHTAAHYMKSGYRIRRLAWAIENRYICQSNGVLFAGNKREPEWVTALILDEILATDWEIDFTDLIDDSGVEVLYKESPSDEEE